MSTTEHYTLGQDKCRFFAIMVTQHIHYNDKAVNIYDYLNSHLHEDWKLCLNELYQYRCPVNSVLETA
jgi:hypothetical protein